MRRLRVSRGALVTGLLAAAALTVWVMNSTAQGVRPVPGPGTGMIMIEGTVNVGNTPSVNVANMPPVNAVQSGDWRISVVSVPAINVAAPEFLQARRSYTITWPDKSTATILVDQVGPNGWVRAGRKWFNLAQASSIEDAAR